MSIEDYHWIGEFHRLISCSTLNDYVGPGEMFFGAWRVWNHYGWRTGVKLPEIRRIAYMKQYSKDEAPPDAKLGKDYFNDKPGANVWFIEKFLCVSRFFLRLSQR